jgi:hypothetical protein
LSAGCLLCTVGPRDQSSARFSIHRPPAARQPGVRFHDGNPHECGCRASRSLRLPAVLRTCTRGSSRSRRTSSRRSPPSSAPARSGRMLHPELPAAAAALHCGPRPAGRPRQADNPVASSICTVASCSRKGGGSTTHFAPRSRTCSSTTTPAPHRSSSGGAARQARLSCATATAGAKAALRAASAVGRRPHGHAQRRARRRRHPAARMVARTARPRCRPRASRSRR